MRALICGDRDWADQAFVWNVLDHLLPDAVIEGHARGADRAAHYWVVTENDRRTENHRVQLVCKPADWRRYGRGAGSIRNREMADCEPDVVVAFHDSIETSKGTADMLRVAEERGIHYTCLSHDLPFAEEGS